MGLMSSSKGQNGSGRKSASHEPVYAQVNKAEKLRHRQTRENGHGEGLDVSGAGDDLGGDSWV